MELAGSQRNRLLYELINSQMEDEILFEQCMVLFELSYPQSQKSLTVGEDPSIDCTVSGIRVAALDQVTSIQLGFSRSIRAAEVLY